MTLLEIIVTTIPEKHIELIQTINSLLGSMQQFSSNFNITKTGNTISLMAELENEAHLKKVADSNEFVLLLGTCRTLGIKSEILINGFKSKNLDLNPKNDNAKTIGINKTK